MNFRAVSLLWNHFSTTEKKILSLISGGLSDSARVTFDTQVNAINLVGRQLDWKEVLFYRRRGGKVDWQGVPLFPIKEKFDLAEVLFSVGAQKYKVKLGCISGHIFDLVFTPGAKSIAFSAWNGTGELALIVDPDSFGGSDAGKSVNLVWDDLALYRSSIEKIGWNLYQDHDIKTITFDNRDFRIIAEKNGDEYLLVNANSNFEKAYHMYHDDGMPCNCDKSVIQFFKDACSEECNHLN